MFLDDGSIAVGADAELVFLRAASHARYFIALVSSTYFESGFPHGKDQFISIAASSWATTALALSLPVSPAQARAEK